MSEKEIIGDPITPFHFNQKDLKEAWLKSSGNLSFRKLKLISTFDLPNIKYFNLIELRKALSVGSPQLLQSNLTQTEFNEIKTKLNEVGLDCFAKPMK